MALAHGLLKRSNRRNCCATVGAAPLLYSWRTAAQPKSISWRKQSAARNNRITRVKAMFQLPQDSFGLPGDPFPIRVFPVV